jgi:hypothetical protein
MHTAVYRFSVSCSALELILEFGNYVRIKLFTYMNGDNVETEGRQCFRPTCVYHARRSFLFPAAYSCRPVISYSICTGVVF